MTIAILSIALLVASVGALIYGYSKNNRNVMLGAAIALFVSGVLGDLVRNMRDEVQAGYRDGYEAGVKARSSRSQDSASEGK